jgi:hypothetical protein
LVDNNVTEISLAPNHSLVGWKRIRHTAKGDKWGPFTDKLSGSEVLGNPQDDS